MGIRDILKNMWSYQPPSKDELKEPISGGNSWIARKELNARIDTMVNNIGLENQDLDQYVYDEYFLMLFQKNYFVNLFDIETDDVEFKKCWNLFVELCFWFGEAAIINNGIEGMDDTTSLVPVYLKEKKYRPLGDVDKDFTYYFGAPILPMMGDSKFQSKNPTSWGFKELKNKGEFVYGKWNTQCYGAWVWMYKFIKFQKHLMYLTHGSAALQKEIMYFKINNTDTSDYEIKQVYNPKVNIIPILGVNWEDGAKLTNRWGTDKISSEKSMLINDVYDWHIQKYYELFGRKWNVDAKPERNITKEVEASQEQFDVLINETKKYMEIALKECKEKFNVEGEFKSEIKDMSNENETPNNSDNGKVSESTGTQNQQ